MMNSKAVDQPDVESASPRYPEQRRPRGFDQRSGSEVIDPGIDEDERRSHSFAVTYIMNRKITKIKV
jgi:hypothetical protein